MADFTGRGVDSATNLLARLLTAEQLGINRIVCALNEVRDAIDDIPEPPTPTPTPEVEPELDVLYTNWLPYCIGGQQYYVAEQYRVNNETGTATLMGRIYKANANGSITSTAPSGTVQDGMCRQTCLTCRG